MVSISPSAATEKGSRLELEGVPGPLSSHVTSEETEICPIRKGTASVLRVFSNVHWSTFKIPFGIVDVDSVSVFVSSTSEPHSDGIVWGLGAGCTQVGTWLVLANSNTRLSGSSSSLYVHANWDRMTLSLACNK